MFLLYSAVVYGLNLLCHYYHATLAQLVEHLIRNERVAGSSPAGGLRYCRP